MTGDYSVTTRVLEKPIAVAPHSHNNVKAGPMIREGVGPSDRYSFLFATAGRGILFEGRADFRRGGAGTASNLSDAAGGKGPYAPATVTYPVTLRLTKTGTSVAGFVSNDGTNFTQIGKPMELALVTYAGIAMSSNSRVGYGEARFDASGAGAIQITPAAPPAP